MASSSGPELKIKTTLKEVAQHFKEKLNIGGSEVFCDVCDERKQNAVKTCLMCQNSYCETHLEPHLSVPRLKKHTLINAVENLEDYICQKHERPLELFCRDDQTCVCLFCTEGEHKTHNTVPIEEESREKKNHLAQRQTDMQQMIQDRIKKIQEIQHSVELRKRNTQKEIRRIDRCESDLLKMMKEQQKAAEKQAEDLIKELNQEITELKRRNTELEQLSHTDDHLHLIQMSSSLDSCPHTKNWTEIRIDSDVDVNSLKRDLDELKETEGETLNEKPSQTELKFVQKFAVDVTLDPETADPQFILSDDGKQVSDGDVEQDVPENKRFLMIPRVLAKQGFSSGRFYYEVQVKGNNGWTLGVARESIKREALFCPISSNGVWTVTQIDEFQYKVNDDDTMGMFLHMDAHEKVGVFVDYEEGLVSIYDVGSRSLIHSFTDQTFTEKLYPYFDPGRYDEGKNSNFTLIITPVSSN